MSLIDFIFGADERDILDGFQKEIITRTVEELQSTDHNGNG